MGLDVVDIDDAEQRVYEAVLAHQPAMADLRHACDLDEPQLAATKRARRPSPTGSGRLSEASTGGLPG